MSYFLSAFFHYFLVLELVIFLFYFTGYYLTFFIKEETTSPYFTFFYKSVIGMVFWVTFFSAYVTKFKTINILFVIVCLFLLYRLRDKFNLSNYKNNSSPMLSLPIVVTVFFYSFIIFAYKSYSEIPYSNIQIPATFFDTIFYSKVADYLYLTGNENFFQEANLISSNFHGVTTYHYFELWLTSLIAVPFKLLSINVLKIIVSPLLVFYIGLGFLSLIEIYKKINWQEILITLLFLFVAGIQWKFFDKFDFINLMAPFNKFPIINILTGPKILLQTIILLLSIILLLKNQYRLFVIPLLCFPFINVTTLPSVFGMIFMINVTSIIFKLPGYKNYALGNISTLIVICICFIVFYILNKPSIQYVGNLNILELIKNNILTYFPTKINYMSGMVISFLAYYFLFVLFMVIQYKYIVELFKTNNKFRMLVAIYLFCLVIALLSISLLSGIPDFFQFFGNIYESLLYLFPFLLYISFQKKGKNFKYLYIILIIFVASFKVIQETNLRSSSREQHYSENYLKHIRSALIETTNPLGACIYNNYDSLNGPPDHNRLGWYIKYMYNYYNTVSLSTFDLKSKIDIPQIQSILKYQAYYNYVVQSSFSKDSILNADDLKIKFLRKYNIQYLIVGRNDSIPDNFSPYISKKLVDNMSGEKFILLNKWN